MVTKIRIRLGTLADAEAIAEFNCAIARETENRELPPATIRRGVERALQLAPEVVYFVAEVLLPGPADDTATSSEGSPQQPLAGCLMLTREWSDWRDGWLAWVQSVYVKPHHRGCGIFRQLLEAATQHLRQAPDVVGMRLYVELDNAPAQSVYLRSGFHDTRYKVLEKLL